MTEYMLLLVGTVLINNFVLVKFLGLCPFMGVSGKLETAIDERVRNEGERVKSLSGEVTSLRAENARLKRQSDQIAARLEAAIARLKHVLES